MPYEEITKELYLSEVSKLKPLDLSRVSKHENAAEVPDKFCDAAGCGIEEHKPL
jgi:hypothetical protein